MIRATKLYATYPIPRGLGEFLEFYSFSASVTPHLLSSHFEELE